MSAQKILIVDDRRAIREELAYALQFEGYASSEAANGRDCLAALEAGDVALVLLDIKMPGMDGLEVLGEIKKRWPELAVIMISGHGDIETAVVALKNGAYDFLPKPFDTERVLVSVKNALRIRGLGSGRACISTPHWTPHRPSASLPGRIPTVCCPRFW